MNLSAWTQKNISIYIYHDLEKKIFLLHNNTNQHQTWDVGVVPTCPGAREDHHQGFVLKNSILIS